MKDRLIELSGLAFPGVFNMATSYRFCTYAKSTCDNSTINMAVTSAQVRMARAALNWTVRDLAEAASVHRNTITNVETERYAGDPETLAAIENVLKRAGVEFIDENGGGAGVRLRKPVQGKSEK